MARPPKAASVIKMEGKSHRTKKELAVRERAEKSLLTGKMMIETAEVRNDRVAHLEFLRLKPLLKALEKFDEIYGAGVRRYCLTKSKLDEAEKEVETLKEELDELRDSRKEFVDSDDIAEYYRLITKMQDTITKREQVAKSFRAEMIDFEKEYCMTIKSALRAIPKKPEIKANALKEALGV
jgi:phage terminase small subunit